MRTRGGSSRALATAIGITATVVAGSALLVAPAATAATTAAKVTVYNNIPAPLPGNVPSVAFAATSASEFGGQVEFAGTARSRAQVTVLFSSWGCQSGTWNGGNCSTAKKATFKHPIQLNVYAVGEDGEPGALLGSVTHNFTMPYRPSANYTKCSGADAGRWYDKGDHACYNGYTFKKTLKLGSLDLPDTAIISVAFNTTHSGSSPIGEGASCYGTSGGCPYDVLNVGTGSSPASVGNQPLPDDTYYNSSFGGSYCDGGAGGTGTFRLDAGCWTGYQPAFQVKAS